MRQYVNHPDCRATIDPVAATQALRDIASGILPAGAAEVAGELLGRLAGLQRGGFGLGTGAALIGTALWGAVATTAQLFGALNVTYGEQESRSLLRLHGVALLYAVGAAAFIVLVLGAIIVPARLRPVGGQVGARLAGSVRFILSGAFGVRTGTHNRPG